VSLCNNVVNCQTGRCYVSCFHIYHKERKKSTYCGGIRGL